MEQYWWILSLICVALLLCNVATLTLVCFDTSCLQVLQKEERRIVRPKKIIYA